MLNAPNQRPLNLETIGRTGRIGRSDNRATFPGTQIVNWKLSIINCQFPYEQVALFRAGINSRANSSMLWSQLCLSAR